MPPQIAILGWGSLLWEGGSEFERWHDEWRWDGPTLPLEFSRVSSRRLGALTLVVDPDHGTPTPVAWCLSRRSDPADAAADLRRREQCPVHRIARFDVATDSAQVDSADGRGQVGAWARSRGRDVVVWTALPSNFASEVGTPFSVREAVAYLKRLSPPAKAKAAEYIRRAPAFVRTPLRAAMSMEPWFHEEHSR